MDGKEEEGRCEEGRQEVDEEEGYEEEGRQEVDQEEGHEEEGRQEVDQEEGHEEEGCQEVDQEEGHPKGRKNVPEDVGRGCYFYHDNYEKGRPERFTSLVPA